MSKEFRSLEEIFADEDFEKLISGLETVRPVQLDQDVEKFQDLLAWVQEHQREPQRTRDLQERRLYSFLEGLRNDPIRRERVLPYDTLGLLGVGYEH